MKQDFLKHDINKGDILIVGANYHSVLAVARGEKKSSLLVVELSIYHPSILIDDPDRPGHQKWTSDMTAPRNFVPNKIYFNYTSRTLRIPDEALPVMFDEEVVRNLMELKHDVMAGKYDAKVKKKKK